MVYPKNNFATDAKYWAREVEKKVTNLENSLTSSDINNTTRDSQLSVAAGQALIAANEAKAAIGGLVSLGSDGSTYDIHGGNLEAGTVTADTVRAGYVYAGNITGNQITGGLITGTTIQTAGSSKIIMNSSNNSLSFTDSSGNPSAHIFPGASESGTDGIYMSYGTGPNINAGNLLNLTNNGFFLKGGSANSSSISGVAGGLFLSSIGSDNKVIIEATAGCEISASLIATGVAGDTTGSFAGNVFINTSGKMFRSTQTSSRDAKENITPIEFDTEAFIAVNPVEFNYKAEAANNAEEAALPQLGFIVEDFEGAGVSDHLIIPTNELDKYKGLRYDKLYMYLHKVVQTQNATIKTLETRLDALEAR